MTNLWLRYLILALSVVGGVGFYIWSQRTNRRLETMALILWLINVSMFHALRMVGFRFSPEFLNNWALGIQLQAVLTIAVIGVLLARGGRK